MRNVASGPVRWEGQRGLAVATVPSSTAPLSTVKSGIIQGDFITLELIHYSMGSAETRSPVFGFTIRVMVGPQAEIKRIPIERIYLVL
jgi:hypothetical protein